MPFETSNIQHQNLTEKDVANFEKLLDEVVKLATLYLSFETISAGVFEFLKHKTLQKRINVLLDKFNKKAVEAIDLYVDKHWASSTRRQLIYKGKEIAYNPLKTELNAYKQRPTRLLSERVWNLSSNFKTELEMAIDVALADGTSAKQLASQIKKYLKEPDNLFRRYRDKNGQLQLSKKAKEYHSGQGVYRSSYKNAERLARTEINMAYREADFQRWQTLDFVTGYEIRRSKHPHPCKICDMMQGKYPKSFRWWGNHPNCRCYIVPIFKEDMAKVPMNKSFVDWVSDNQQKINEAKHLPMFLWGAELPISNTKEKVSQILKPFERKTFVAFEPFSPIIREEFAKRKDLYQKKKLFNELLNDQAFEVIHIDEKTKRKTILHPLSRETASKNWLNTQQMAKSLNKADKDVIFLAEYKDKPSEDALLLFKGKFSIADFKYFKTTKPNTIATELIETYRKTNTIVMQFKQADLGIFQNAIETVKRKERHIGNIIIVNKYGKIKELSSKELTDGKYIKILRGFF